MKNLGIISDIYKDIQRVGNGDVERWFVELGPEKWGKGLRKGLRPLECGMGSAECGNWNVEKGEIEKQIRIPLDAGSSPA